MFKLLGLSTSLVSLSVMTAVVTTTEISTAASLTGDTAQDIGTDAYIWGYPLVVLKRTEAQALSTQTRPNQFARAQNLATPASRSVVLPNNDTLYASAWLDLRQEPLVLSVPNTEGRYYTIQFQDAYTNTFNYVGTRTTGTVEGSYAIIGPDWQGELPAGLPVIKSPTNTVWALGRTVVDGPADLPAVRSLQQQYTLTPLSLYPGSPPTELPPIPNPNPLPRPQDVAKSGIQFFDELSALLKDNPPPADELPLLERFAQVGIGTNRQPSQEVTDPDILAGLTQGIVEAEQLIDQKWLNIGTTTNGWRVNYDIGNYGNDYLLRAAVAKYALAANVAQESLYFLANVDANGNPLVGTNKYVLTFGAGQLPPVDAFWSVTLYDPDGFLVENSINRYSIGDRTPGLQFNPDGSLSIYLQSDAPIVSSSNWLPTPNGSFSLSLRAYLPKPELLDGTYQLPPVVNVAAASVPESSATSGILAASIVGTVVLRSRRLVTRP